MTTISKLKNRTSASLMLATIGLTSQVIDLNPSTSAHSAEQNVTRKMIFPPDHAVGTLLLWLPGKRIKAASRQCGLARGAIEVKIPAGMRVIFEPSPYAFTHPSSLDAVAVDGVDALNILFLSMDADEEGLCDKLLTHLGRFKTVTALTVANSDTTDRGLNSLPRLPKLISLDAEQTRVNGDFLKNKNFAVLTELEMNSCPVRAENYKVFANLKMLVKLGLAAQKLDPAKLTEVSKCTDLVELDLHDNPKIDDNCVPVLLHFKKLRTLNLAGTTISLDGLRRLSLLKLEVLKLPRSTYTENQMADLKRKLNCTLVYQSENSGRTRDLETILAPRSKLRPLP